MSFSTQDITRQWASLPASQIAVGVNEALHTNSSLVVTAPPGAGKSTLLPLTILSSLGEGEKILMLEPRRLAARQIAERMAQMLGEQVGETVGYRVRFESRVSKRTRIEVLTEGILTRMIVDDATLDGVSVVIFDEFHERSINSDLALALTRQAQQIIRPDLKVVIMSATIDTSNICAALQAPLIESVGRMFPVELHYADEDTDPRDIAAAAASTTIEAYKKYEGDILVFLPGQAEIERCYELLSKSQHLNISGGALVSSAPTTPQHLNILFAGRLEPQKGVVVLCEVLKMLAGDARFFFTIAGDGSQRTLVEQTLAEIAAEGKSANAELVPPIFGLAGYMQSFDYLFMPSEFEGLSMLSMEASLNRLPVIANACPGLADTLPADWSLLAHGNNIDDYRRIFDLLPTANRDALTQQAYAFAKERFSVRTMQERYEAWYKAERSIC